MKCYRGFVSCYLWVYWLSILCPYTKCFDVFIRSCIFGTFEKTCWFFRCFISLYKTTGFWFGFFGYLLPFPPPHIKILKQPSLQTFQIISSYKNVGFVIQHLLQWVPLCSVGLQLLGGAWVRTDQNLKAFREVLGHTETWITSVAHVDAKNWLCFPDENFQVDLDTCFCSGRQIIWIYVFTLICISAEICLRDLLNSKWA